MEETFDLLDGINLSDEDKKYYKDKRKVNNIIISIIKRRIDLGMSQRDLALKSGIKQPMIARIEKFDNIPRLDTLLKLLDALDLTLTISNQ